MAYRKMGVENPDIIFEYNFEGTRAYWIKNSQEVEYAPEEPKAYLLAVERYGRDSQSIIVAATCSREKAEGWVRAMYKEMGCVPHQKFVNEDKEIRRSYHCSRPIAIETKTL